MEIIVICLRTLCSILVMLLTLHVGVYNILFANYNQAYTENIEEYNNIKSDILQYKEMAIKNLVKISANQAFYRKARFSKSNVNSRYF